MTQHPDRERERERERGGCRAVERASERERDFEVLWRWWKYQCTDTFRHHTHHVQAKNEQVETTTILPQRGKSLG